MKALIGYTGLVGSNLDLSSFDILLNRKNLGGFARSSPTVSELYVAAGDARKWFAASSTHEFETESEKLISLVSKIRAQKVVLFSTIDVYDGEVGVVESDVPSPIHPYGRVCFDKEKRIKDLYEDVRIVRLPGLFGRNLKKNFIFDLVNRRQDYIYKQNLHSTYQYFNLRRLNDFCALNEAPLVNLVTEPISIGDIINFCKVRDICVSKFSKGEVVKYDSKTKFSSSGYFHTKELVLKELRYFIQSYAC